MNIPQNHSYTGLDMEASGARIDKLIKESGLTDRQISEEMNISVQAVYKWRRSRSFPDINNLYILSQLLGTSVDAFLVPVVVPEKPVLVLDYPLQHFDSQGLLRRLQMYAQRIGALVKLPVQ